MNTTLALDSRIAQLKSEGVCVFKEYLEMQHIQFLQNEIKNIGMVVTAKLKQMTRPIQTYTDIAERELCRLDYRCGFNADIFQEIAAPIIKIIKSASPTIDFKHYWGVITALPGAGPTDWHRDVYPILNTTVGQNLSHFDLSLPPYYFTVLMPLVEITAENGPTAFIKGSQREAKCVVNPDEIYAPLSQPGDLIIFEGRTMHCGQANRSHGERMIAYITFVANWYHDQTFVVNQYLFPELATPHP